MESIGKDCQSAVASLRRYEVQNCDVGKWKVESWHSQAISWTDGT